MGPKNGGRASVMGDVAGLAGVDMTSTDQRLAGLPVRYWD